MAVRTFLGDRGDAGKRLDLVLRRHLADLEATRTRVQTWIAEGTVSINGRAVRRVATRVATGDVLTVDIPQAALPRRRTIVEDQAPLDILFEDQHLLAVHKPAGMVAHPTHAHPAGTLLNLLAWHGRGWPNGARPSLVGRLDKLTSGVVLVAKTAPVHAALQRRLTAADAEKDYLAVVYGRVRARSGTIDLRLRRDPDDRRRVTASASTGAVSVTRFERLAEVPARKAGLALVRCRLVTGRTHQIRAHLAASGWPIVGDPTYGEPRWTRIVDGDVAAALRGFPRQALHAWRLVFTHPVTAGRVEVEAPIPDDLRALLMTAGFQDPEFITHSAGFQLCHKQP